jgi:hypothetical protein
MEKNGIHIIPVTFVSDGSRSETVANEVVIQTDQKDQEYIRIQVLGHLYSREEDLLNAPTNNTAPLIARNTARPVEQEATTGPALPEQNAMPSPPPDADLDSLFTFSIGADDTQQTTPLVRHDVRVEVLETPVRPEQNQAVKTPDRVAMEPLQFPNKPAQPMVLSDAMAGNGEGNQLGTLFVRPNIRVRNGEPRKSDTDERSDTVWETPFNAPISNAPPQLSDEDAAAANVPRFIPKRLPPNRP